MSSPLRMALTVWGARGMAPCPEPALAGYGGHTACIELRIGENLLILDAGSGLRPLGAALLAQGGVVNADIFCSHPHLDHVCGLPWFGPLLQPGNHIRFWSGPVALPDTLESVLAAGMGPPLMEDARQNFASSLLVQELPAATRFHPCPGVAVSTAPLTHPGGVTGFRIEVGGRVLAYLTDTEAPSGTLDENVLRLADGADLMIHDATWNDAEHRVRLGQGHSSWRQAVAHAEAAGATTLLLFHHAPLHDDAAMDAIAAEAEAARPGTLVAREGMRLTV
jgi:phosphoribosyl 1,2-cyclic phosphodiesterase